MKASWVVELGCPSTAGGATLVICPHAGGGPAFYRGLGAALGEGMRVCAVNYSGRERLIREPHSPSLGVLAASLVEQVQGVQEPVVLFGHSMGAIVAFEAAMSLGEQLRGLIVSGHPAPTQGSLDRGLHRAHDDVLVRQVEEMGAVPEGLFQHPEFRHHLIRLLRHDLRAAETHRCREGTVGVPLVAYAGEVDAVAPAADVRAWASMTSVRFRSRTFPGGHFYFTTSLDAVAAALRSDVTWCTA